MKHFEMPLPLDPEKIINAQFNPFMYCHSVDQDPYDVIMNGLQEGGKYPYIDSTFIQGLVNHNDGVFGAFMFRRYSDDSEWQESVDYLDNRLEKIHSRLDECLDDVILLNMIDNPYEEGFYYIYLWYDHDVSDCTVGIFDSRRVKDPEEAFYSLIKCVLMYDIGEFTRTPKNEAELRDLINHYGLNNLIKFIPNEKLGGWIQLT